VEAKKVKEIFEKYLDSLKGLKEHCDRCLRTERWGGSVLLMIVDAAFTSIGLNYFTAVVPKVKEFRDKFVTNRRISSLKDLSELSEEEMKTVWRNERSLKMVKEIARYLQKLKKQKRIESDREVLRYWASRTNLRKWQEDPIGKIRGVGINTFQYLRMMGGVDTVMPDKIVKRVIEKILKEAGIGMKFKDDIEFVEFVHQIANRIGRRPIELCWMTWLIQREGDYMRMEKYRDVLKEI